METLLHPTPTFPVLLGLGAFLAYLIVHFRTILRFYVLTGTLALSLALKRLRAWIKGNLFTLHLVGMSLLSVVSLGVCLILKPFVQHLDPTAMPYDETLLQKMPLTVAVLCILFPSAMLIIRFTVPGMYRYLNYTFDGQSPDKDLFTSSPIVRLYVSLGYLCFIVFLGVLVFTGKL